MITNHDIEIAFVRAQNRINENLERAQFEFMRPDLENTADILMPILKGQQPGQVNRDNPLANEEI